MSKMIFLFAALSSSFAFAHGTRAGQATEAVKKATSLLEATASRAVINSMIAVHAVRTGHEQFLVSYEFQGNPPLAYSCVENESQAGAGVITWDCVVK